MKRRWPTQTTGTKGGGQGKGVYPVARVCEEPAGNNTPNQPVALMTRLVLPVGLCTWEEMRRRRQGQKAVQEGPRGTPASKGHSVNPRKGRAGQKVTLSKGISRNTQQWPRNQSPAFLPPDFMRLLYSYLDL